MAQLIEDYALIGDSETVALVGRDGSIDWLCLPRFDSAACFAALLGTRDNGRWRIAPSEPVVQVERSYRGDTLVLETVFTTESGSMAVIDFMPLRDDSVSVMRIVEGRSGTVAVEMELIVRFDYGAIVPWVHASEYGGVGIGGADGVSLRTTAPITGRNLTTVSSFDIHDGERVPFTLCWFRSHEAPPQPVDPDSALEETERWWAEWAARCRYEGDYGDAVLRSLITLKALTFAPTGGVVAAPTTSLPEWLGGVRNWDYRYCWLRDATFTLTALSEAGFSDEAVAWSEWLRRAVAGSPDKMQIMYGVGGERRLPEQVLDWLPGYEGSAPVRIGNAASDQFQLDVYGEVMDMFLHSHSCLDNRLPPDAWDLAQMLVEHVREVWNEPDDGIWEVRGPRRHFVHSKVMAWVAIDRWVQLCRSDDGRARDLDAWRTLRDDMHRQICEQGYNPAVGAFTQYYGAAELDASCLMLALVGFLPPTDPRIVGTVEAIQRDLLVDGFVRRYRSEAEHDAQDQSSTTTVDGLPPGEGAFLLTTFWLVDNLVLLGRDDEARSTFERLIGLANDVGLLAEEYDVAASRLVGNFPQAFSHVGLILSAHNLSYGASAPALHRRLHAEHA
jgi:GH15 family glucan-1,4-alpha-glucosidase